MAKLIVQHDEDPGIAIVLEALRVNRSGRALGWHGTCTQCGRPMYRWDLEKAVTGAKRHVDSHESAL